MVVLICLIAYLLPIIIIGYAVYRDMKPGETVEDYIYRTDLEDCLWAMFLPGINILCLLVWIGEWIVCYVSQLRKPYDYKNK